MTKRKDEYYEKWQMMERKYSSLKQKHDRELVLERQSRCEFEAKWNNAKEILREREAEIQKVYSGTSE